MPNGFLYGTWEKVVNIKPDRLFESRIDFNKMVTLTVTSKPIGAEIYVDEKFTGAYTPKQFMLRVGKHTITVRRKGYIVDGEEKIINLENDFKKPLKFTLRKIQ